MVCTVSEYRSSEVLLFYTASIVVAVYGNVLTVFLNDFIFAVYPDAFNLVAGIFIAGYAVYAETVQAEFFDFRSEFFGHSLHAAVGDSAVGEGPGENGSKFIAGKCAVTLELSIREPFQEPLFCQIFYLGICPVILRNIREEERAWFL